MSVDYGIKVSKPGYSVLTATPEQLIFSSKYMTPRVHFQGSGQMTHTGGRTITIAHNLGYIPLFQVHSDVAAVPIAAGVYYPLPYIQNQPYYAKHYDQNILVWADTTNLYIKAESDFGYVSFYDNDAYEESAYNFRDYFAWGHNVPTWGDMRGAVRFGSVAVPKNSTIYDARLEVESIQRVGSNQMYWACYGIDEDNTGDFSSNPIGRPKTSYRHRPEGNPSNGSGISWGVTGAMQEIVNRSGWSSGNNMGFLCVEDGDGLSPSGNSIWSDIGNMTLRVLFTNILLNYKYTIFKDKVL